MKRIDRSKKFLWQVILCNSRLKMYEYYIELAKSSGYKVCSLEEFWADRDAEGKHLILRHDIDHKTRGVRRMYEVEKRCGVKSTYYFRHCTLDQPLMVEMQENGFEVGLHFETIADYSDELNLDSITEQDLSNCRERLKKEIIEFQKLLPKKIFSICSHGALGNDRVGYSNNALTEGQNYSDYGISLEAYDKELYDKYIDAHIMDGTICTNYGFSYATNPIEEIEKGTRNIMFLSHPNHWHQTISRSLKDIIKLLLRRNQKESNATFARILYNRIRS